MSDYLRTSLDKIWLEIINGIASDNIVDNAVYDNYISNTFLYELNNENIATIHVGDFLSKTFWENNKNLQLYVERSLSSITNCPCTIQCFTSNEVNTVRNNDKTLRAHESLQSHLLNEYNFDNFVVGSSNKEAYNASYMFAENDNLTINPLFIYGNSGLGKTHLLHSIGNHVLKNNPNKKVLYISGDEFVSLILSSFSSSTTEEIKSKICELDYLLIDDIQRIVVSDKTQEIFFSVYEKLINFRKKVIMTSDIHPKELSKIHNRLVSRFSAGLSLEVRSPEQETAIKILHKKLEGRDNESLLISDDAIEFIASTFKADIRKLEGALNEMIFKAIIHNPDEITLEFAQEMLGSDPMIVNQSKLTATKIKRAVCDFYGLTKTQLESKSRTANISNPRHIAIYLCRKHLDIPFVKIGFEFGNRDHSTVMSSCVKVEGYIKENEDYRNAINKIERSLGI